MECCGRWQTDRQTDRIRQMNYSGLIIAVITFLVIGLFHPLVIKSEYYFGTKCWWAFALAGLAFIVASLLVENSVASPILGVVGVLLPVEHIGDFRTEGESQERLVSDESEEEVRVLGKARVKP